MQVFLSFVHFNLLAKRVSKKTISEKRREETKERETKKEEVWWDQLLVDFSNLLFSCVIRVPRAALGETSASRKVALA